MMEETTIKWSKALEEACRRREAPIEPQDPNLAFAGHPSMISTLPARKNRSPGKEPLLIESMLSNQCTMMDNMNKMLD